MNTKKQYQLNYLSELFYSHFDFKKYPEIANKDNRPYMVLLIKIKSNTFAIPFRTNIHHNSCYKFKTSTRSTDSVTGIDYTKAVIVNNIKYIGKPARINDKEYTELSDNYGFIINQFQKFVSDYIKYANSEKRYYASKKFKYATLKYFHKELGIE